MAKQVWFKFYPADWLLDPNVRSLHPHQRDAYFTLLCYQAREGSIPDDEELCRRIVGYEASIWHGFASDLPEDCQALLDGAALGLAQPVWDSIEEFFSLRINESERANPKLHQIIKEYELKYREISTKRSAAGKLGGLAKAKQKPSKRQASAKQRPSKCSVDPDPDPDPDPDLNTGGEEKRATASRSPRRGAVYWDPMPTWKPDHPSLETAQLKVEPSHLTQLVADYPDVDVPAEIRCMKNHALENPGWARVKRNWKSTLGKWLRRSDERLRDARFKGKQARASPADKMVAEERSWELDNGETAISIAACEKKHGPHKEGELKDGSKTRYCEHGCGYYVAKKE